MLPSSASVAKATICCTLSLAGTWGGWGSVAMTNANRAAAQNSAFAARPFSKLVNLSVRVERLFNVIGCRLLADFLARHARGKLDQLERMLVVRPLEHGEVRDDHVDDVLAGQRKRAFG